MAPTRAEAGCINYDFHIDAADPCVFVFYENWTDRAALEDVIQPEDVADAAWWLGAGAAKTTGEVLLLDAGYRLTKA